MEPEDAVTQASLDHDTQEVKKQEEQEILLDNQLSSPEKAIVHDHEEIPIQDSKHQSPALTKLPDQAVESKKMKVEEFASETMTFEGDHLVDKTTIWITGSVQKGSTLTKYTAYIIVGEDEKGKFEVLRRYSEFDALRALMKERWPGCFIPVLPDKSMIKNSMQVIQERERLLSNFVQSMASSRHLYYSEEFQMFLRSGETDVSGIFEKMQKAITLEEIVNRYKDVFTDLGGKELDGPASIKISSFRTSLRKIQQQLGHLEDAAVSMAISKDQLNQKLPTLFTLINRYEKNTILEFSEGRQDKLVYLRQDAENLKKHPQLLASVSRNNPFWLLSDLIKLEVKDCQSFLQTMDTIDTLTQRRMQCQQQIRSNQQEIDQLAMGKSTVSSMTTRKSKEEVKRIIEDKNKKCIMEKHNFITLTDMVSVLISYIEIDNYKRLKKRYYKNMLKKVAGAQGFLVITMSRLWNDVEAVTQTLSLSLEKKTQEVPKPSEPTTVVVETGSTTASSSQPKP